MEKLDQEDNDTQTKDGNNDEKPKIMGLTTTEALEMLQNDIKNKIKEYKKECRLTRKYKGWLKDALYHKSQYTTFCWISATALLISAVLLIVSYCLGNNNEYSYWPYEGIIIIVLVLINLLLVISDNKFRHFEILHRVKNIVKQLETAKSICKWKPENYPHLYSPLSPCITLQWTYRDGQIVNLPWALLVAGDIIVMKPGQQAPGFCIPYDDNEPKMHAREVYCPGECSNSGASGSMFSGPQARLPMRSQIYKLQETPYLTNLQLALDEALDRPVTVLNRERHLAMTYCVERLAYPVILVLLLLINLLRCLYLGDVVGVGHWSEMFILQPVAVTLPLLPLVFPFWWLALNCFGMARFKALFKLYQSSKKAQFLDPFDESSDSNHPEVVYNWTELSEYFWDILFGKENMMTRSANIVHVLGSVTALCCIDKKGILSWPNPTAEKVFFLRHANSNPVNTNPVSKASSTISENKLAESNAGENTKSDSNRTSYVPQESHAVAEVLDLTHDRSLPFKLQFDDHSWHQHLNSLKPLGLAILLNTCNMETQEHYMQFCCHVTCESLHNENLVPVTNRSVREATVTNCNRDTTANEAKDKSGYEDKDLGSRMVYLDDEAGCLGQTWCLCELAMQIGFKEQAKDVFYLEQQLSTFRHVPPETAKRDMKFARSLKLKFPFPHMVAVVVKDKNGGTLQLLTQGTADIILDSCVEFWSGQDLSPLTDTDKKKVQDFYNRMSLTSYCTAFAYRPLTRNVSNRLTNVYMELPSESKHLYVPYRSPTPLPFDFKNVLDPRIRGLIGQFHSTDSLLYEAKDEEICSIESCFEMQCNQVFIGMVTMQYQAQADMVQLIEQLELACIRFVHFSKENELRSRVFSEKMGLESGWNCHISLLSERARETLREPVQRDIERKRGIEKFNLIYSTSSNLDNSRTMSLSAPSAINTDISTVRFENEMTTDCQDKCQTKSSMSHREHEMVRSDDSVLMQSVDLGSGQEAWRSLSCLTDSTEQSAPVNFDMSNRAKLPRGIDKIRSHIDNTDNVPLLVSLFTDCNTPVTREMLHIMQDYGEVVCVLGSSANAENMPIFMQADAAIAVEPLYPQVCQRVPVLLTTKPEEGPSPIDLSRSLNSIACSLSVKREDPIAVYHLIMEARNYMKCLLNCLQFWMSCAVTIALVQALAAFFLLPPLFSPSQVLWLCVLVLPLLSASLIGCPNDPSIMSRGTGKNQCVLDGQMAVFALWCYGGKFLLTILTVLLWQGLSLHTLCSTYVQQLGFECNYVYPNVTGDLENISWGGWSLRPDVIDTVQHISLVILVLHFVTVSASFVHRDYFAWQKVPFQNWTWVLMSLTVICLQAGFSGNAICSYWKVEDQKSSNYPINLPYYFIISLPLVFLINEFIKWQEMKVNIRYHKRARLQFTTKLGMNSPF